MIEHRDGRFFQHAGAHIDLANSQAREAIPGQVAAAMIFATARFSAFAWAMASSSGEDYESRRQQAQESFMAECRRQFDEHYNDHARNFDRLMNRPQDAG